MADDTRDVKADVAKPQKKPFPIVRFAVEFGDKRNRNFTFPLGQKPLRGRWEKANYLANTMVDDKFAAMPDIPGIVLEVDSQKRWARFVDPLSDPRNEKARIATQNGFRVAFSVEACPEPTAMFNDLSEDELKSYIYWTRRILDNFSCKVIHGRVPEMDDIAQMPGLVSLHNFDQGAAIEHMKPIQRRYKKPTPERDLPSAANVEFVVDGEFSNDD